MNWDDLRIFLAVARAGRLEPAGLAAGVDSSTVSRRVARLEAELGVTLFEHGRSGHQLTSAGVQLMAHAEQAERAAHAARESLTGSEGRLRVSVSEGFGTFVVARRLCEFHARHPGIAVELVASAGFLSPSRREADLAVMLARPTHGPLIARRLTDYGLGLYAARSYLTANGAPAEVAALSAHPLIGYVPDLIYAEELRYLSEIAPGLEAQLCSSSIGAQAAMLGAGAGIGVLPHFIARQMPGLAPVLPAEVDIRRTFWLVVHRDARQLARVDAFIRWLVDLAGTEPLLRALAAEPDHAKQSERE
ncbi:LysR family transcriptional regulator [Sandaracinobacter neustonicus]|uniref:LysR family transcriptional regulator n=1 Tax=Sandaracinobacter neustonicus TaxID=1715348 RepID=A0A501XKF1_9SPHN|nr:LysR family transcriptional regulator [Sandaracinobacter neustonicus]TPE61141.1 LysR family transcriptional regulator [Sandaracinobacter neustonicus]